MLDLERGQADEQKVAENVQAIIEVIYVLALDLAKLETFATVAEVLLKGCVEVPLQEVAK